jgi:ABC-type branched-subunit amino acid transport system ATPase component
VIGDFDDDRHGDVSRRAPGEQSVAAAACTQRPSVGEIWFDGKRIDGKPAYAAARLGIARTFQIVRPFAGLSVIDNLVVAALYGHAPERTKVVNGASSSVAPTARAPSSARTGNQ